MSKNNDNQNKDKKPNIKDGLSKLLKVILISIIAFVILYFFSKSRADAAVDMSFRYLKEMIIILPAVLVIMGLADVWVPTSLVKKYLGHSAGIRGKILAIILGTIPAGPMYVALPCLLYTSDAADE